MIVNVTGVAEADMKLTQYHIYVLKLQYGRYYVGITHYLKSRIAQHFEGRGAKFTTAFKPESVVYTACLNTSNYSEAARLETLLTLKTIKKYGAIMVRGGRFTWVVMPLAKLKQMTTLARA